MPTEVMEAVRSMLLDLEYLAEMRALEDSLRSGRPEAATVVPVSGLAVARLHVKENELRTALQHWTPRLAAAEVPPPPPPRAFLPS